MAKWLYEVGAAADIRTANVYGSTPLTYACMQGHLHVAKWLFQVGASSSLQNEDKDGNTAMKIAADYHHEDVVEWLLLQGAANDDTGHVDPALLLRDVRRNARPGLRLRLQRLLDEHANFTGLVLPAACAAPSAGAEDVEEEEDALAAFASPIALLRGNGHGRILRRVADFAGVRYGRKLRTAGEALRVLDEQDDEEGEDDGEGDE